MSRLYALTVGVIHFYALFFFFFIYSWHHFSAFLYLHISTKWGCRAQTSSSLKCGTCHSFSSKLTYRVLGESVQTTFYLVNHIPTPLLSHILPYEILHGKSPTYSHIRSFGCLCYVTNLTPMHKFDMCACRCIFVGYPLGQKGYCVYDLDTKKIFISQDVIFHEHLIRATVG